MGQPTPPGDSPLIEGLSTEWNELVQYIPEDRRAEFGPKLRERVKDYETKLEAYKPWDEFQQAGITPEHADTAVRLFTTIENNPREVYEAIGKHLNITPAEAKQVVEAVQEGDQEDPRIQEMQHKIDTLAQIQIAQRDMSVQEQRAAEADQWLDEELEGLKSKVGDTFPEEEILMRMVQLDMTAEEAYENYSNLINQVQTRRPAPMLLGQGGSIPSRAVDPTKLDSKGTKSLVAQMLDHANAQRNS